MNLAAADIATEAGVVAWRRKLMQLLLSLGAPEVEATQLAVAWSEVSRAVLSERGRVPLGIEVEPSGVGTRLSLLLSNAEHDYVSALASVFRHVTKEAKGLRLEHPLPLALADQPPAFVERLKERLREPSRAELLAELKHRNEALERHRRELENTVSARTKDLQRRTEEAHQANRAKSEFLSHMSHELRTPLNGVLGYAQILLRDAQASEKQKRSLNAIESCGRHLLTLINDVLDLSKIEAGRMELDPRPLDLHALLEAVCDIVRPRAAAKGVRLSLERSDAFPRGVLADETKLKQVLVNLLGNSAKFTEHGEIVLRARADGDGSVALEVSDTGIGMTPEELSHLFEPFRQAEGGKVSGGTGLGLAITQRVVHAMGGTVRVESERGKGTTFRIELPVQLAEPADAVQTAALGSSIPPGALTVPEGLTALIVDDVETNRSILDSLLEEVGFAREHAGDGREALDKMRARPFDLVLMDIKMPNMGGDEAIRIIRGDSRLAHTKVIALTASVQAGLLEDLQGLGFDDVLGKPFEVGRLLATVSRHLGLESVSARPESEAEAPAEATGTEPLDPDEATALSKILTEALALGDISGLMALGEELEGKGGPSAAWGRRLAELSEAFDFDGLEQLAVELQQTSAPE